MVTPSPRRALTTSPASGWWWICLLTAALFVFHVHYVRFHLLTEAHHSGSSSAEVHAADHHDDDHARDDHDHDRHQPHSASEHELQLAAKQQFSFVVVDFLVPETWLALTLPEPRVVYCLREHSNTPGESPPDPAQPRAPPTA